MRGLVLLLLMVLAQAETALSLACDRPEASHVTHDATGRPGHTHCASGESHRGAPHNEVPGRGESHDGPSCAAMPGCVAAVALPSLPTAVAPAFRSSAPRSHLSPLPVSRAESPGNPPPRA